MSFDRLNDLGLPENRLFIPPGYEDKPVPAGLHLTVWDVQARITNLIESGLILGGKTVNADGQPTEVGMFHPDKPNILDEQHLDGNKLYNLSLQTASQVPMLAGTHFGSLSDRIAVVTETQGRLHLPDKSPVLAYQNLDYDGMRRCLTQLMTSHAKGKNQTNAMATCYREAFWKNGWEAGTGFTTNFSVETSSSPRFAPMAVDRYMSEIWDSLPSRDTQTYDIVLTPLQIQGEGAENIQANIALLLHHDPA
ncbi:MAG TPA: hypothetical protein VIT68_04045 [Candidatus Gracilibacteria bacterium]